MDERAVARIVEIYVRLLPKEGGKEREKKKKREENRAKEIEE